MTRQQDPERAQLAPSSQGSVMLDLGGDIGALVLHTGAELLLAEVEVSRVDGAYPLAPGYQLPHQHHLGEGHGSDHDHSHGSDHDHSHGSDHDHSHGSDAGHSHHAAAHEHPPSPAADGGWHAHHRAAEGEHAPLRTHVAVRERHVADGVRYAAIFAGLLSGEYRLWNLDGTPGDVVAIVGGQVTEHTWP